MADHADKIIFAELVQFLFGDIAGDLGQADNISLGVFNR